MECRLSLMYVCISMASLSNLPLNVVRKELENLANMSRKKQAGLNALLTGFGTDYVEPHVKDRLMARADYSLYGTFIRVLKKVGPKKKFALCTR